MLRFRDDFTGNELDTSVWVPHYLPAWSSRALTKAEYRVADSTLSLFIPPPHGLWCPEEHPEPLRVSGIQSGNFSGPVGSSAGQQRFRDDLIVREQQPISRGWLPEQGRVEIRCRMDLSPRSMAAMWLSGFEEDPDQAGELCVVEVFGRSVGADSAEVGVGIKKLYDPDLVHDFVSPRIAINVADDHVYAVEWNEESATFTIDGEPIHRAAGPPTYPMQVMIAVFDFPRWSDSTDSTHVPRLDVDWIAETGADRFAGYSG